MRETVYDNNVLCYNKPRPPSTWYRYCPLYPSPGPYQHPSLAMLYQGNLSTISIKNYLDTIITILYMDVGTYLKR